jgi:hypothetical protein
LREVAGPRAARWLNDKFRACEWCATACQSAQTTADPAAGPSFHAPSRTMRGLPHLSFGHDLVCGKATAWRTNLRSPRLPHSCAVPSPIECDGRASTRSAGVVVAEHLKPCPAWPMWSAMGRGRDVACERHARLPSRHANASQ